MEGDAGASRLNPTDADDSLRTKATTEDSKESEVGADPISAEVTAEDSKESEVEADPTSTEVTAEDSKESEGEVEAAETDVERGPSRLGRWWLAGITAALLLAAGGLGVGGYLSLRSHQESQAIARSDAAALEAAKSCVAATQAPDTSAATATEQKIIDCGTDEYRSQALLYSGIVVQAYQAANAHVQVSDIRAAVERNNSDGSVDVLVALRIKVSNDQAQNQETGYRLRARMALADGQYRIAKLDTVTK
jgi:Mce-associated membrane protein